MGDWGCTDSDRKGSNERQPHRLHAIALRTAVCHSVDVGLAGRLGHAASTRPLCTVPVEVDSACVCAGARSKSERPRSAVS